MQNLPVDGTSQTQRGLGDRSGGEATRQYEDSLSQMLRAPGNRECLYGRDLAPIAVPAGEERIGSVLP